MKELLILNLQVNNREFEAELQDGVMLSGVFYATVMEGMTPNMEDGRNVTPQYDIINIEVDDLEYTNEDGWVDSPKDEGRVLEELKSLLGGYV